MAEVGGDKEVTFRPHVISYADDFVILSRGYAEEAPAWTKAVVTKLALKLNEAKTTLQNARKEHFDFLATVWTLSPTQTGHWYLGAGPSKEKAPETHD
jgi:RNA-directed DNA polymerase